MATAPSPSPSGELLVPAGPPTAAPAEACADPAVRRDLGLHLPAHPAQRARAVHRLDHRVRGDAGARRPGARDPRPPGHAREPQGPARPAQPRPLALLAVLELAHRTPAWRCRSLV